jgi:hypothetical protein
VLSLRVSVAYLLVKIAIVIAILANGLEAAAQTQPVTTSAVEVGTVYSSNGAFYLRTVPFDNQLPPAHGRTRVYTADGRELYSFDRAFSTSAFPFNRTVFLSDDGNTIFSVRPWFADDGNEHTSTITVYRRGTLIKSYSLVELMACSWSNRCAAEYFNNNAIAREKSHWGHGVERRFERRGTISGGWRCALGRGSGLPD